MRVNCPKCGAGTRVHEGTSKTKCPVCSSFFTIELPAPTLPEKEEPKKKSKKKKLIEEKDIFEELIYNYDLPE